MKYFVIFVILCFLALSEPGDVKCKYEEFIWEIVGRVNTCLSEKSFTIESENETIIDSVSPAPEEIAKGFHAMTQAIRYFPSNLNEHFPELELIFMYDVKLKELTQNDLKSLTKLRYLGLERNHIEVLENGLFDYNPDLQFVRFYKNKITHVGSNVFDNLNKLTWLDLDMNECISKEGKNRDSVKALISQIRYSCPVPPETTTVKPMAATTAMPINRISEKRRHQKTANYR